MATSVNQRPALAVLCTDDVTAEAITGEDFDSALFVTLFVFIATSEAVSV